MTDFELLGEIIEASTTGFVAQCPKERLHQPPAFGAFVKVIGAQFPTENEPPNAEDDDPFRDPTPVPQGSLKTTPEETLFGLVTFAETGSIEPGRRAAAYGLTEEALRQQQPQIFDLLATTFHAVHLGYASQGRFRAAVPPYPPRLHGFVAACSAQEVCAITETPDFLRTLLTLSTPTQQDELIAACLRQACSERLNDFAYLVRIGKQLAVLLRDFPDRLTALLQKLQP